MKNLTSIILILLSVGIFFFFTDEQYKKVQVLQVQIEKNKEIIDLANQLTLKRQELQNKFSQISESNKQMLEKLLPNTVDNVRLIIDINNIASQFGIVIKDININSNDSKSSSQEKVSSNESNFNGIIKDGDVKYVDQTKIGVISFSFSVSAKYEVFVQFLEKLEESLRIVDIRDVQVSRPQEGVFYNYKVTMDTYWLK